MTYFGVKRFKVLIFILAASRLLIGSCQAQTDQVYESPQKPITCEEGHLFITDALRRNLDRKNPAGRFIVIVRPGKGENSPILARRRMQSLKEFILSQRPKVDAVFANGEQSGSLGVIELFVDGGLLYTLPLRKNQDFDLVSCRTA